MEPCVNTDLTKERKMNGMHYRESLVDNFVPNIQYNIVIKDNVLHHFV